MKQYDKKIAIKTSNLITELELLSFLIKKHSMLLTNDSPLHELVENVTDVEIASIISRLATIESTSIDSYLLKSK